MSANIYIYIYIYLVDKVPQDITSTVLNIYAHMRKLDKKDTSYIKRIKVFFFAM